MIRRPARGFDSRWARRWRDGGTDTVSAQEYFDYYAGWARIYEAGEIISSDDPNEIIYLHKIPSVSRWVSALGISQCS